ncbi:MAG: hypothetical protein JXR46_12675 [Calditrichaceae bacterium]|nr:hypothetical protein [Calditrichaceae bacterium]MBN2709889.1 hypothetical protein [Calditrichaceae bacterium]RQV92645.1 MAG: hypothetical protein EH224_14780 [Calditrichota bacterium]
MVSNKLLNRIKNAHQITVLTGSDLSQESGLSVPKENEQWEGYPIEKIETLQMLKSDPGLFWKYFNYKRNMIFSAKPNLGHYALVDFEKYFGRFDLITLNTDGLHHIAGNKSIIELNGNIMRTVCTNCDYRQEEPRQNQPTLANCPKCAGLLRPDVRLRGEEINKKVFNTAHEAAATCEVFFCIGIPDLSEYVSSLPLIAKANGSYIVEINTQNTSFSNQVNETILAKASKILPLMVIVLEKIK